MQAESDAAKQAQTSFIASALSMAKDFKAMRDAYVTMKDERDAAIASRDTALADAQIARAAFVEMTAEAEAAGQQLAG